MQESVLSPTVVQTDIPFRLDRLPLSRFHLLVVVGLGVTWILDGLEVTIVGSLGPALQSAQTLNLSSANLGAVASFYVVGAVTGALGFGWITDRFGRRLVFYVTLIVYLTGVLLSALAWDFWSFAFFRMVTGLGIGGEYAAVNSAIDELIPAKYRGRIDLIVNGSFWLGAAAGALAAPVLLDQNLLPVNVGWRLGFGIGGVLGFSILMLRQFVPESPRWLVTHCRGEEAEETVKRIEADVVKSTGRNLPPAHGSLKVHPRKVFGLGLILSAMLGRYRQRSILALTLMVAQSFLYNSVFFTFGLIIANFYHVPNEQVGLYLFPSSDRQFLRPASVGLFIRHRRPQKDDCRHLCNEWRTFACNSLHVRRWLAFGNHADDRLVHHILFCISCRQFRLPHSKRNISPRNASARHCLLLRARHRHRRRHFSPSIRVADRIWFGLARESWICNRRPAVALRGRDRT